MSQMTVTGNGPIRVFLPTDGTQLLIPLSAVVYDDTHAPKYYALNYNQPEVAARISELVKSGVLRHADAVPKKVAMVLQSVLPGSWANAAQVTVAYSGDKSTFSVTVTVTSTYTGLSPSTIVSVLGLGTTGALGPSPGLAHVKAGAAPAMPKASTVAFTGGTSGTSTADILTAADGAAFTLEAWKSGAGGDKATATISNVNTTASTFDLQIIWTNTVSSLNPNGFALSTLNNAFGHVLTASVPPGSTLAAPQAGTFALSGGADAAPAKSSLVSL